MISYITGLLGGGKSLYAVRKIARHLLKGGVVTTNIELLDKWWEEVLSHAPYYRFCRDAEKRRHYQIEMVRRYAYEPDFQKLMAAKVRGSGEGRGLMILDEAHNEIGHRQWKVQDQSKALRKLTLSRKRGWDVLIVTQDMDNTDVAARRLSGLEIRVINWRQWVKVPITHNPLLPFNLFLAQTFPTSKAKDIKNVNKRLEFEMYHVGWYGRLYKTDQDYDLADEVGEDRVQGALLPLSAEAAEAIVGASPVGEGTRSPGVSRSKARGASLPGSLRALLERSRAASTELEQLSSTLGELEEQAGPLVAELPGFVSEPEVLK